MRNLHLPGRSVAHSLNGMAATSHPLATLAAVDCLRSGGNAMDAAIAAVATQGVVEPQSTGIGGDCFAMVAPASGGVFAFNGSGRTPKALSAKALRDEGMTSIARTSAHAVTVPGAVDGWDQLQKRFGNLTLKDVLAPAIDHATSGYVVSERVAFDWAFESQVLAQSTVAAKTFLIDGKTPPAGAVHHQPALAKTLQAIADGGRNAFYQGDIADEMRATLNAAGGLHSAEDFSRHRGEFVEPVSTSYKGHYIYECPPNGQGIIALLILNIMKQLGGAGSNPRGTMRLHLEIEAARLAYSVRDAVVADPAMSRDRTRWLLSDELAAELAGQISRERRTATTAPVDLPKHKDTVIVTVVDKDRNAVSLINSTFFSFGSGIVTPTTGITLHNRGMSFSLQPGHPNELAGGKRPMHTIIPGMVMKDGQAVAPFGVMGGQYQALGHAHLLSGLLDFGMDVQEAIDAPRVMFDDRAHVEIEDGTGQQVRDGLARLGHKLVRAEKPIGGAQIIHINSETGVLSGGSDCRKDGLALGY